MEFFVNYVAREGWILERTEEPISHSPRANNETLDKPIHNHIGKKK